MAISCQQQQKEKIMIKNIYSVYDLKAGNCLGIFEQPNDLVAIRDFSQVCANKDEKNMINKFAEDYQLIRLGKYNTITGEIEADKQIVAYATDYVGEK